MGPEEEEGKELQAELEVEQRPAEPAEPTSKEEVVQEAEEISDPFAMEEGLTNELEEVDLAEKASAKKASDLAEQDSKELVSRTARLTEEQAQSDLRVQAAQRVVEEGSAVSMALIKNSANNLSPEEKKVLRDKMVLAATEATKALDPVDPDFTKKYTEAMLGSMADNILTLVDSRLDKIMVPAREEAARLRKVAAFDLFRKENPEIDIPEVRSAVLAMRTKTPTVSTEDCFKAVMFDRLMAESRQQKIKDQKGKLDFITRTGKTPEITRKEEQDPFALDFEVEEAKSDNLLEIYNDLGYGRAVAAR